MKKIIPLFLLALLPLAARAYDCVIWVNKNAPIRYSYAANDASEIVGEIAFANEVVRVAIVCDTREDTSTLPFSIDLAGNLIPADGLTAASMGWMELNLGSGYNTETPVTVNPIATDAKTGATIGVPKGIAGSAEGAYSFEAISEQEFEGATTKNVFAYLVVLDTCDAVARANNACSGQPTRVGGYAVRQFTPAISTTPLMGWHRYYINSTAETDTTKWVPGFARDDSGAVVDTWKSSVIDETLTALTVDGKTYTPNNPDPELDLFRFLMPQISSTPFDSGADTASLAETADSGKVFRFYASSPDIVYYTLYSGTSLADRSSWEKVVDTADEKKYTKFRIDGNSLFEIPVSDTDKTRFYQFRMN